MPISAVILGDVKLFRDGLAGLLRESRRVTSIVTAAAVREAIELAERERADAILIDMAMAGSLEQIREITNTVPNAKVIAIGVPETATDVLACAEAGAAGYVPREASAEDLIDAVEAATRGELRCSTRVAGALLERVAALARGRGATTSQNPLTDRELDVLSLLERGHSNKEIAFQLGIELATVKNHVHNILEKLGVRGRAQAIAITSHLKQPPHADRTSHSARRPTPS